MTAPLSQDLRERVRAVGGGSSIRKAAARYQGSPSAAVKLMRRVRETGSRRHLDDAATDMSGRVDPRPREMRSAGPGTPRYPMPQLR